jgi:hypothetical protein
MVQLLELKIVFGFFANKETQVEVLKVKLTKGRKNGRLFTTKSKAA